MRLTTQGQEDIAKKGGEAMHIDNKVDSAEAPDSILGSGEPKEKNRWLSPLGLGVLAAAGISVAPDGAAPKTCLSSRAEGDDIRFLRLRPMP